MNEKKIKVLLFTETFIKYGIRKVIIYEKYFNKKYFDLYLVYNNPNSDSIIKNGKNSYLVPKDKLFFLLKIRI